MATKSTLITNINNYIDAVVTVAKHRLSMLELVNEFFPTTYIQTVSVGDVFCELNYTKSGNKCHVYGSITNNTSSIVGAVKLVDFPNSVYYPKGTQQATAVVEGSMQNVYLLLNDSTETDPNSIYLVTNLGAGSEIIINITYIVND